jgi:hypothetical protein
MKTAEMMFVLFIAMSTCPVFSTISKAQMQSWIQACDLSQGEHENCRRYTCLRALSQLVKSDTRHAYENLGMGSSSDLNVFSRLYDYCRRHSRQLEFNWGTSRIEIWENKLLALRTYRDIHSHLRVSNGFVVPTDDLRWPIETHGMKLGRVVDFLRQTKATLSQNQLDALDELEFNWGISHTENWKKKLLALRIYRDIYGHLRVSKDFVVPTDELRWPIEMHGMKLGSAVLNLRQRNKGLTQNQLQALEELGFDWGVSHGDNWGKNLLALSTYDEIFGHMRLPQSFVVPTDDPRWPEETHGIKLGRVVSDLRRRKDTLPPNRIDALNFFGFEWNAGY